ncbi:MAG: HEAT repeat domain-containing protein [candidate division Zixibacteria bacterium]|nr:HEAT repeat domain-containing protein [candidate division Zixibacteria bacterium]MDH3936347.1 HEAT repeat domain-containing protein [candidate division Zixibacteria bacterium]MDH4035218.1 HEAT repeat domain-containing protein [candidate division Zixibacteria bacterium]
MFERQSDRHELPDARWYVIRNTVFVLGSLKDPEGVAALRLRINDNDIRVRREIVRSLEKIGGDDACDLLIVMADDRDQEISESSVIAAGIIGRPDSAPLFIDVARRHPLLSARCVFALGKMGGSDATAYLIKLLGCDDELSRIVGQGVSKDDIRLAVIKALGSIGGEDAINSIQEYRDGMSRTHKLFSKNSPINKAIQELLEP